VGNQHGGVILEEHKGKFRRGGKEKIPLRDKQNRLEEGRSEKGYQGGQNREGTGVIMQS